MIWLVSRPEARPVICRPPPPSDDRFRLELELEEEDDETELVDMRDPLSVRQSSAAPAASSSTVRGDRLRSGVPQASVSSMASRPETSLRSKCTCRPDASSRS